ncbi:SNF2 domain-containing protein [Paenibacillus cellulosilyticus]|uniref:SNF2 domain-containing protein n=1 Tax=Paenibacillus cellulosilyticus TaxID=375489 RepID=A0A2V2YDX2_9BACL|nr:DEAD/DEAH box helicase [Paenibacillus cellulosilyticus]PWV90241.1 SNF2 domain-containing protein [Paenibacillus cellulosilyticus]QKS43399.1 DEAD/DEAH box helicase [Paenibacillus cellulosilyticus]
MRFKPHKYQEYAIERILDTTAVGLFLEMGLGKTIITLTAVEKLLYDSFEAVKVLVIAPLRVAEDTWSRESSKWDHTKHLRISKILGDRKQREKALLQDADIYVVNRENVQWLVGHLGKKWPFDTVIVDELSSFKNSDAQRFRALRRIRPLIKRIVGLTGTPAPNSLLDLWAQIYLLDQGERLGKTVGSYRDRYFIPGKKEGHVVYEWKQKKEADDRIHEAIADICVSMKAEDWLEMPQRVDRIIPLQLSETARDQYEQLERDLLLPMVGADIVANTAAALSNKLLQMANGAAYDEERGVREIHDVKLNKLEDLIEAANGNPVLVFYAYKHDLSRIKKRFPQARTLDSADDIAAWNAGEIPLLLAHPASAGHGLNLQDGGSVIVWFGLTWSLELYQQANARLYRQGQTKSVIIHHLVVEGSIDEDVIAALESKADGQNALMAAVKARIEGIAA